MAQAPLYEAIEIATGTADGYRGSFEQVFAWLGEDEAQFEIRPVVEVPVDTTAWNFWN